MLRPHRLWLACLVAVASCSAEQCGKQATSSQAERRAASSATPDADVAPLPGELKLVDMLAQAELRTQDAGTDAASREGGAKPARPQRPGSDRDGAGKQRAQSTGANKQGSTGTQVLRLDFDSPGALNRIGWSSHPMAPRRSGTAGNHAVAVRPREAEPLAVVIPAEPNRFYRIRRARKGPAGGFAWSVLETRVALAKPQSAPGGRLNAPSDVRRIVRARPVVGSYVKLGAVLDQHTFAAADAAKQWQRSEQIIFTGAQTRSLALVLRSRGSGDSSERYFDDIGVTALNPSRAERWTRLAAGYDADASDPVLPAFAQFLVLPPTDQVGSPEALAYAYRHGLVAQPGSSVSYTLTLPAQTHLAFGLGLARESPPEARAKVQVRINGETAFERTLASQARRRWSEHSLELTASKPQKVTLELAVAPDSSGFPVWSNPSIWQARDTKPHPDVFLVAVDTLRADRLGLYGHSRPTSPALQALAQDSVVFERAVSQSNWTPESFASLFTSEYAGSHGVTHRLSLLPRNTLAGAFRDAGYFAQGIAFKLLLYDMGFERGFDAYFNVPRFHLNPDYGVRGEQNLARARHWLEQFGGRQAFLFLHLNDPHQPFNHPEPFLGQFADVEELAARNVPPPILISGKKVTRSGGKRCSGCVPDGQFADWFVEASRRLYDEAVAYTDAQLAKLVRMLKAQGRYEDAIIAFVADHGEGLAEHHDFIGHGGKHMYAEQVHVPLVIKPPANSGIAGGQRVEQLVSNLDIAPTLLELARLEAPETLRGRSLVPLMRGESLEPRPAFSENIAHHTVAVRSRGYRYVLHYGETPPAERLFDLREDPNEQTNLVPLDAPPDILARLRRQALQHIAGTHPGRFLLLEGPPTSALSLRARVGQAKLQAVYGAVRKRAPSTWTLRGGKGEPLLLRVRGAGDQPLTLTGARDVRLELPAPNAWSDAGVTRTQAGLRVSGFQRTASGQEQKESTSGQTMEALRALGYIE